MKTRINMHSNPFSISLSEIIIQKIQRSGAIPFRDFMEMALYYPELGYYTSPLEKIGKPSDYYTSSNLTLPSGKSKKV